MLFSKKQWQYIVHQSSGTLSSNSSKFSKKETAMPSSIPDNTLKLDSLQVLSLLLILGADIFKKGAWFHTLRSNSRHLACCKCPLQI